MFPLTIVTQLTLTVILTRLIYLTTTHPLSQYPGPFLARFTNIYRFLIFLRGDHHIVERDLHQKYGPVVRVAPNWLSFSDLDAFLEIYGFNKAIEKSDFYLFNDDPATRPCSIFSAKSDAEYRVKKRVLGPLASGKVGEYESVIQRHVDGFVAGIVGLDKGECRDIAPLVHRFTVNTMLELLWGPAGLSKAPDTDPDLEGICFGLRVMTKMAWAGSLFPLLGWMMNTRLISSYIRKPTYNKTGQMTGLSGLVTTARELVFTHPERVTQSTQPGILKSWLEVPPDNPNRMKPDEIWSEAFNLMIAGPGSTAAALTALLYHLGSEEGQAWQTKLRELAIDDACTSLEMNAVIKETLRLQAPFPTAFPRVITPGAEEVIPHLQGPLPVGATVSANTYVLGRSREIWGGDAEEWVPVRWMGSGAQRRELEGKFVAFSRGSRSCIGKELALLVIARAAMEVIKQGRIRSVGELTGKSYLEMQFEGCRIEYQP